ncbi:histidine kinase dimerization/phospho-acceptor domain-containing protein [uncultured Mucilaginibacter sp.]|uniref:histidine kinase dimerization/phospho-acceptor domain-containing protein n=1 Tax=uncultured Mucilaginibacter sp. TaxID=797541 RepID=UPI0025FD3DD5|nr:histidine kinase dimerization/phospho-acceptor domain-containing protein [uncultured Mucilaginibacter sp.]
MDNDENNSALRSLRHDIKNQLSSIVLSASQLRYEMPDANEDSIFYLETIENSCKQIIEILDKA